MLMPPSGRCGCSPAEGGVEDLKEQLVGGGQELVLQGVRGGPVHHTPVLRQHRLTTRGSSETPETRGRVRSCVCALGL